MDKQQESVNKDASQVIDEAMGQAQERLEQGMKVLNDWTTQARDLIQRQPAVMLAGAAVLGFLTGLLIRRTSSREGVE